MGISTFSGPIRAGNIANTTGTTLGENVRNVGSVLMIQHVAITQASSATALGTSIVLPANSHIIGIQLAITAPWITTATLSIGTTATATELAAATATSAAGIVAFTPGTDATKTALWDDTGTTDKRIFILSGSTGTGVGSLTIRYIQAHDLAST